MPATLTSFTKAIQNLKYRRGSVFVAPAADLATVNTLGVIKDAKASLKSKSFGPDTGGRTFPVAVEMELTFALLQTGPTELQNLPALAVPSGNGLYVAITDGPVADPVAPATLADAVAAFVSKIEFTNATVEPSAEIDFGRGESGIMCSVKGEFPISELEKLYVEPIALG